MPAQQISQGQFLKIHPIMRAMKVIVDGSISRRITTRQQTGPRGGTDGSGSIELSEPHPLRCHFIDMGRSDSRMALNF